ncbi:MAG: hypothetical protein JW797_09770 [Bradymonadales bacterium]|nr:hypothetical protein [Bradymonadales bacterium]
MLTVRLLKRAVPALFALLTLAISTVPALAGEIDRCGSPAVAVDRSFDGGMTPLAISKDDAPGAKQCNGDCVACPNHDTCPVGSQVEIPAVVQTEEQQTGETEAAGQPEATPCPCGGEPATSDDQNPDDPGCNCARGEGHVPCARHGQTDGNPGCDCAQGEGEPHQHGAEHQHGSGGCPHHQAQ